jgi:hypothetical protein
MTDKVANKKVEMRIRRERDSAYTAGPSGITRYSRWLKRRERKHHSKAKEL